MTSKSTIIGLIILALVILVPAILNIYGDWLWFLSLDYGSVFWTILSTQLWLGLLGGIGFILIGYLNFRLAKKFIGRKTKAQYDVSHLFIVLILVAGLIVGLYFAGGWDIVLKYSNYTAFGLADPVFGEDVGFYVFILPFYKYVLGYLTAMAGFSLLIAMLVYINSLQLKTGFPEGMQAIRGIRKANYTSFWLGVLFLLVFVWVLLARFDILFSMSDVFFGAGYTDLTIKLPLIYAIAGLSLLLSISFFAGIKKLSKAPVYIFSLMVLVSFVGLVSMGIVQGLVVNPNEFDVENPYIQNNIEFTRKAYGLEAIVETPFQARMSLTKEDIADSSGIVDNIRLWDWRPLQTTYNQLQIFRTYYTFSDVDIDRYTLSGKYKQVMLSAREMDQRDLPESAQTWVNKHLVYTHGYGLVMSPVERVTTGGLPEFYIKDIPPKSDQVSLERPEIYYGQLTNEFVITNTKTDELDYPTGDKNVYTNYKGTGGLKIPGLLEKLAYAVKFGSIEMLFSGAITPDSKLMFNRQIENRVAEIAPFLAYDTDPYLVVSEGKMYWIQDAYTITDRYPYSEPIYIDGTNYIRNSVKIVIDAYNGRTDFYVMDKEDPVVRTYSKMFPDLFKDFSEMSEDLKKHIRYPEDLLVTQAFVYQKYHMKDAGVFYNKEDEWRIPYEKYRESKRIMTPYFVIMKLPGEEKEEFVSMLPFVPKGKENLIGWMAARSDGENYGKLFVYMFSKQELVYGPMQVEARIDQDTDISQLITLWDQMGSDVIRGNTLVIPIKDSILYVDPLYLEATEAGSVPELKRVIVVYGDKLVMRETLDEALEDIFGKAAEKPAEPSGPEAPAAKTREQLIAEASSHYTKALSAQKAGDWGLYGQEIENLGEVLERLEAV